jgi:hypothetical protein
MAGAQTVRRVLMSSRALIEYLSFSAGGGRTTAALPSATT